MKILFLDESGDHNLSVVDPEYPLFVLGGIIVEDSDINGMNVALSDLKRELFGQSDIVFHTADIIRNRNGFERLAETRFREKFRQRVNRLMTDLKYSVVACAIRKDAHLGRYGVAALDPYLLSLDIIVERFCLDIRHSANGGVVVAEMRGAVLDRELELAWLNLKIQGTRYVNAATVNQRISGLNLRPKNANIAGLQIADLVVSPIGRHLLGKPDKEDWHIVESKFRRSREGKIDGYGLVVLPK